MYNNSIIYDSSPNKKISENLYYGVSLNTSLSTWWLLKSLAKTSVFWLQIAKLTQIYLIHKYFLRKTHFLFPFLTKKRENAFKKNTFVIKMCENADTPPSLGWGVCILSETCANLCCHVGIRLALQSVPAYRLSLMRHSPVMSAGCSSPMIWRMDGATSARRPSFTVAELLSVT